MPWAGLRCTQPLGRTPPCDHTEGVPPAFVLPCSAPPHFAPHPLQTLAAGRQQPRWCAVWRTCSSPFEIA